MTPMFKALAAICALGFSIGAQAQWPERPVKIVVPFPAANSSDVATRVVGEKLGARLGQPVIVENIAGAGGVLGTAHGAKQPADGYNLIVGTAGPLNVAPWTQVKPPPYDSVKDFVVVGTIAYAPQVLITRNDLPVKNFQEFAAYAKAQAEPLKYGSSGVGTTGHLLVSQILRKAGVKADHIPYRGGAQAIADLRGGHTDFMSDTVPVVKPLLAEGSVKALGVVTTTRLPSLPNVPTLLEQGLAGADLQGYIIVMAPAKTPEAIVKRLRSDLQVIGKDADVRKRIAELGMVPIDLPQDRLDDFIRVEAAKWKALVDSAGIAKTVQ